MSDFNKNSPHLPSNQPFNVTPRRGAKKNGWWLKGHNNPVQKAPKK